MCYCVDPRSFHESRLLCFLFVSINFYVSLPYSTLRDTVNKNFNKKMRRIKKTRDSIRWTHRINNKYSDICWRSWSLRKLDRNHYSRIFRCDENKQEKRKIERTLRIFLIGSRKMFTCPRKDTAISLKNRKEKRE